MNANTAGGPNIAAGVVRHAPIVKPWRVTLHTADGWIHVGNYGTDRGARQALRIARNKHDYMPLAHRVGGTDTTYAVTSREDRGSHYGSHYGNEHGCPVPPEWTRRSDIAGNLYWHHGY